MIQKNIVCIIALSISSLTLVASQNISTWQESVNNCFNSALQNVPTVAYPITAWLQSIPEVIDEIGEQQQAQSHAEKFAKEQERLAADKHFNKSWAQMLAEMVVDYQEEDI